MKSSNTCFIPTLQSVREGGRSVDTDREDDQKSSSVHILHSGSWKQYRGSGVRKNIVITHQRPFKKRGELSAFEQSVCDLYAQLTGWPLSHCVLPAWPHSGPGGCRIRIRSRPTLLPDLLTASGRCTVLWAARRWPAPPCWPSSTSWCCSCGPLISSTALSSALGSPASWSTCVWPQDSDPSLCQQPAVKNEPHTGRTKKCKTKTTFYLHRCLWSHPCRASVSAILDYCLECRLFLVDSYLCVCR